MKNILILGAGLSSSSLIRYLLEQAVIFDWHIRIVDQDIELVRAKIAGNLRAEALHFDIQDIDTRRSEIAQADIVISMLPARFHMDIAKDCIDLQKHVITPSYASQEMLSLDKQAKDAGILIMNEIGVDPGIDHMSAMKIIDQIKQKGGVVTSFRSFCGGLVAPESDTNPWNYKFTWNPRNVVLAGAGGAASFIRNGRYKYIPYFRLFERTDTIYIDGYGEFTEYPNRDSLRYRASYGLENTATIYRGTLRKGDFCQAWNVFVELGMTDDTYVMSEVEQCTPRMFLNAFLPYHPTKTVETKFLEFLRPDRQHLYAKFEWLGLFEENIILKPKTPTPAQLLQQLLEQKWTLHENDKDMIVMMHEVEYTLNGEQHKITSSMVNIGENQTYTSMSNTVGLPVGICTKLVLNQQIKNTGVMIPINKEIYTPILTELEKHKIQFVEKEEISCLA